MKLYNLAKDRGLKFLAPPHQLVERSLLGNIVAHNFVTNPRRKAILDDHISNYYWQRRMVVGFKLRNHLVQLEHPTFRKGFFTSRNRVILNGDAGNRARNLIREKYGFSQKAEHYLEEIFREKVPLDELSVGPSDKDELWVETKNLFNFYHYLSESHHQANWAAGLHPQIASLTFYSKSSRALPFASKWMEADPIISRLNYKTGIAREAPDKGKVLAALSSKHLTYQTAGSHLDLIEGARPAGQNWQGFNATSHPVGVLSMNSYDESLAHFRRQMIATARKTVTKEWSDKIYVMRSSNTARKREMIGEERLVSELVKHGFEVVYFEDLAPLEQVKCTNGAKVIGIQHGAGLTNMLFAHEKAHIFELGTYQTALRRWIDFMPICHTAGCHFHSVFLDMCFDKEDEDPVFAKDGLVAPRISDENCDRIIALILKSYASSESGRLAGVSRHLEYFKSRRAFWQSYRLLDQVKSKLDTTSFFWESKADIDMAAGNVEHARNNLLRAWKTERKEIVKQRFFEITSENDPGREYFLQEPARLGP